MYKIVRDLLISTPELTAIVPASRWYRAGAVIDQPPKPFVILRWLSPVGLAAGFGELLRVDVHDERGSYDRIRQLLGTRWSDSGVYKVLIEALAIEGDDGYLGQCDYLGESGDQEDPEYNSNYMFSSWQVMGRKL
jgi:hypothetical protein